jgi:6-pyruvoyl-tetrahydropterin synthase
MSARIQLRRSVTFRAHHRLAEPGASEQANRERFGWTAEPHSHQYRCTVTVTAPLAESQAMVIDLPTLDRLLAAEVIDRFEGRHLDRDLAEFAAVPATCEAIARAVYRRLVDRLPLPARLVSVRIAEDESLDAECLGDAATD